MGVWGRRLNLSPWYSSPWVRFSWLRCCWLGAVAGVGDTSKTASKWKHHSPFTREEMFLNQLGSHLGSLETVPGPLRSASSPSSATKHTPPFAPPFPPPPQHQAVCVSAQAAWENLFKTPQTFRIKCLSSTWNPLASRKRLHYAFPRWPFLHGQHSGLKVSKKTCSSGRYTHLIADTQFHN